MFSAYPACFGLQRDENKTKAQANHVLNLADWRAERQAFRSCSMMIDITKIKIRTIEGKTAILKERERQRQRRRR